MPCPRCNQDTIEIEVRNYDNLSVSANVWTVCRGYVMKGSENDGPCGYENGPFKL